MCVGYLKNTISIAHVLQSEYNNYYFPMTFAKEVITTMLLTGSIFLSVIVELLADGHTTSR